MYSVFFIGLIISIQDILFQAKTLVGNITKRIVYIMTGIIALFYVDSNFLEINTYGLIISIIIGLFFLSVHLLISRGIKLHVSDINIGFLKTCILIYAVELPAEEFLYRGILMIPLCSITNNIIGVIASSLIFMVLHIRSWSDKRIWVASFILALVCGLVVINTHSIWSAIIIHNLNDFGFLTLVNKRNIFVKSDKNIF